MTTNIKDKTVLITGGANGIGFHYAQELLRNGAKCVAILDLPTANGENAVAKLEKEFGKGRAIFLVCDVTNAVQMEASFKKVVEIFKGLDILINNAGILDDKHWEHMVNINFTALVRGTLLGIDLMGKHKGGKGGTIVNIGSIIGIMPTDVVPVYSATKHAVVGFSRSIECTYERTGVRILVICPGVTTTPLITDISDRFVDAIGHSTGLGRLQAYAHQTPMNVARAMVTLIEKGKNGTVCVSEDNEPPYTVDIPHYTALTKHPL